MPKIKVFESSSLFELEAAINNWVNTNWENISEVYEIRIAPCYESSWYATVTYEVQHGK